ncbi:MAG: cupin domain-containing protein [Proteobacteria bacterium]|nr:cupin domain-containing protein [Pseudomonadota bacterium]
MGAIGARVGAQKLGYNLTVLPPGKRAWPAHSHRVNEEMFFVVEGEGEVRIGAARHPIRAGDVIACPPGGPDTAHQIANTSPTAELKFLAISTKILPEMVDYPDSGKFGVATELQGADGKPQMTRFLGRAPASQPDYWDGEG